MLRQGTTSFQNQLRALSKEGRLANYAIHYVPKSVTLLGLVNSPNYYKTNKYLVNLSAEFAESGRISNVDGLWDYLDGDEDFPRLLRDIMLKVQGGDTIVISEENADHNLLKLFMWYLDEHFGKPRNLRFVWFGLRLCGIRFRGFLPFGIS